MSFISNPNDFYHYQMNFGSQISNVEILGPIIFKSQMSIPTTHLSIGVDGRVLAGRRLEPIWRCISTFDALCSDIHCKRSALSFAEHGLGYDLRIELFPDWQLLCIWLVLSLINADLMTSFTTAVSETILAFWREITSTEFSLCFLCIIQQYDEWWMQ